MLRKVLFSISGNSIRTKRMRVLFVMALAEQAGISTAVSLSEIFCIEKKSFNYFTQYKKTTKTALKMIEAIE